MFAHWLCLSHWKSVHVGEGIPLTSLSPSHKTREASEQRRKGICQCNCNQPFLWCPEDTETRCLSKAAQRLLLPAAFVPSASSIWARHCEQWELLLQPSTMSICTVHSDETGTEQLEFHLEICKSFVVVELTGQNHLSNNSKN